MNDKLNTINKDLILIAELPSFTIRQQAQPNPVHTEATRWLKCTITHLSDCLFVSVRYIFNWLQPEIKLIYSSITSSIDKHRR